MITLYWAPRTRAARILWLLEEAGLDYKLERINFRDPDFRATMEFGLASPMGKIPAIKDGSVYMADSAAIALYLADGYPDAGLAPEISAPGRGRYLYWMTFTPGTMEPAMLEAFGSLKANKSSYGHGDWATMIKTLEAGLQSGDWLMIDTFSAADILVGSTVHFFDVFGIMPDSDILKAYLDRCRARPAFQRMMEIDAKAEAETS